MHKESVGVLDFEIKGIRCLDFNDSPLHCIVEDHLKRYLEQCFLVFEFFCHEHSVVCYQAVEYPTQEATVAQLDRALPPTKGDPGAWT
jgi:hypothetical protein